MNMKNHESLVFRTIVGILADIQLYYPELPESTLAKQLVFFNQMLTRQGLAFATLVLPEAGKWFDHCLSQCEIQEPRALYQGRVRESKLPKFMNFLWQLVFDSEGVLRDDHDPRAVFFLRQVYYFAKKLEIACDNDRTLKAVRGFIDLEKSMVRPWPSTWSSDTPEWGSRSGHPIWGSVESDRHPTLFQYPNEMDIGKQKELPWKLFDRLCRRTVWSWGHLDVWSLRPKHGRGAVADGKVSKYLFTNYSRLLNSVFPADWFASHDFVDRTVSDRVLGSRMCAVPKTQKGPRLIATEPASNQWIQGALQRWLEGAVERSPLGLSIDFRRQSLSQALALESSANNAYATIDLSEASDRISTRLVQYVFQGNLYLLDALHACRTPFITIPMDLHPDGVEQMVELRKFSTMGSAVTFPIQTIIFTLLGHFALMCADEDWRTDLEGMRLRAPRIRVFGDDIIIDAKAAGYLGRILEECGLVINKGKSFIHGPFRESCGMDAFGGVDVTPAYIRQAYSASDPASLDSVVETSNNFHKKGMWSTAMEILKTVPEKERELIVRSRKDSWPLGLYTYSVGEDFSGFRTRWNDNLQRKEIYALTTSTRSKRERSEWNASLLQYFTEEPDLASLSKWEAGQEGRPRQQKKARWVAAND